VTEFTQNGGYLGAISLMSSMPPVRRYIEASRWVRSAMREDVASIVCSSILSALEGRFGAYHSTERTSGNSLWINPLMTFYWGFQLGAVAERVLYLEDILETESYEEVVLAIETFRARHDELRNWEEIPI
jgi:hypothetical protein